LPGLRPPLEAPTPGCEVWAGFFSPVFFLSSLLLSPSPPAPNRFRRANPRPSLRMDLQTPPLRFPPFVPHLPEPPSLLHTSFSPSLVAHGGFTPRENFWSFPLPCSTPAVQWRPMLLPASGAPVHLGPPPHHKPPLPLGATMITGPPLFNLHRTVFFFFFSSRKNPPFCRSLGSPRQRVIQGLPPAMKVCLRERHQFGTPPFF